MCTGRHVYPSWTVLRAVGARAWRRWSLVLGVHMRVEPANKTRPTCQPDCSVQLATTFALRTYSDVISCCIV